MANFLEKSITDNKGRSSNIELLRIFAMMLIVLSHLSGHGIREHVILTNTGIIGQINNFFLIMFGFSGKIGVNIFVLISGFFLINKKFKIESFLKIFVMTLFYSVLFLILSFIIGTPTKNPILILQSLFPIGGKAYWFVSAYLILYVFSDYINTVFNNISQEQYKKFLFSGFVLWALLPSLTVKANYGFSDIVWFLYMYSLGGYIRKYKVNLKFKTCFTGIIISLIIQSLIVLTIICQKEIKVPSYLFNMNCLYQFFTAFFIFNIFKNLNINFSALINGISSSAFAVYLIHDNNFVRPYLWNGLLHAKSFYYSDYCVLYTMLTVILIYTVCILADKILSEVYTRLIRIVINNRYIGIEG